MNSEYWQMGLNGAMFQMIAHGISSAGMFFMVGVIYERVHHRNLDQFGGLFAKMPVYSGLAIGIFFAFWSWVGYETTAVYGEESRDAKHNVPRATMIAVIGLGWGGLFTLYNMLAVSNFGLREIGRINGTISMMESIGAGLGSVVTGLLFDQFGSYRVPFIAVAVMVAISLVLSTQIRSEVDERALLKPA